MAASFKIDVKPAVLVWARRTIGWSREDAARKLARGEDKVPEAVARLRAWEDGEDQPTLAQVRRLAEIYKRPLAVFLLAEPPQEKSTPHDFRRVGEAGEMTAELHLALREARERRETATQLMETTGDRSSRWSFTASQSEDAEALAARIRAHLDVDPAKLRNGRDGNLRMWREAIESAGVLVFGFPGVDVSEARGFALTEGVVPAIGLNNNDAPAARAFTLMHELTHVALRTEDALCDLTDDGTPNAQVERYCNHVAGAVLVPRDVLLADPLVRRQQSKEWEESVIGKLASSFVVSREVVLRRLLILGRTTAEHYAQWRARLRADHQKYRDTRDGKTGGPTQARTRVAQLGRRYTSLVLRAAESEAISLSDASDYLGVKIAQFGKLADELRGAA